MIHGKKTLGGSGTKENQELVMENTKSLEFQNVGDYSKCFESCTIVVLDVRFHTNVRCGHSVPRPLG